MKILTVLVVLVSLVAANKRLKLLKEANWAALARRGFIGRERDSIRNNPVSCVGGKATIAGEDFPCDNVDFLSFVSLQEIEITTRPHVDFGVRSSDIWGWQSPNGAEITIMCMDNGAAFIDTTDPLNPCSIATIESPRPAASWCDIKVYKDTAYIVKDTSGGDSPDNEFLGGQVFDLLRLEEMGCPEKPIPVEPDFTWDFHGSSHNLIINTETGFLYSVGGEKCNAGLVIIDLNKDRLKPEFVSCAGEDGYTHDAQCVIYTGPDTRFQGREICFAFNEDTLTIWDVDDKLKPEILSRKTYPSQVYTHQGWLTEDMTTILMDDELNELCSGESHRLCNNALGELDGETRTSTLVFDVSDLTHPIYTGVYHHKDRVVDHNLYLWGPIHAHGWGGNPPMENFPNMDYAYFHNYCAGLRILDISSKNPETFKEVGFFDVAPDLNELSFLGAWSGYMHPSGAYAVASIERGLFMLNFTYAFGDATKIVELPDSDENYVFVQIVAFSAFLIVFVGIASFLVKCERIPAEEGKADETEELKAHEIQASL